MTTRAVPNGSPDITNDWLISVYIVCFNCFESSLFSCGHQNPFKIFDMKRLERHQNKTEIFIDPRPIYHSYKTIYKIL